MSEILTQSGYPRIETPLIPTNCTPLQQHHQLNRNNSNDKPVNGVETDENLRAFERNHNCGIQLL